VPDNEHEKLLQRIADALTSRRVPPLVRTHADEFDWELTLRDVGCLWDDGAVGRVTLDSLEASHVDMIWLTAEQFRCGFLRLTESALRYPETDVSYLILKIAAEPVSRGRGTPPARVSEFSLEEIRLIADCLKVLHEKIAAERPPPDVVFSTMSSRVVERALKNWRRFAARAGK